MSVKATYGEPALAVPESRDALYSRIAWRLMPILFIGYIVAYLDRVNVGFAKLQMIGDLHFSDSVYGVGAGIFFWGYFFFEVPSNLILHKVGARVWICRVLVVWGLVSALTAFVSTPFQFYAARFLLGVAEAGFFPGMVLYLTYWFPSHRRAKMMALLMAGNPVSGLLGGPLSGFIMRSLDHQSGWAGWQWLFVLEAAPAVVLGVVVFFYLDDRVATAKWLSPEEKQIIANEIEAEAQVKQQNTAGSVFVTARVWLMCAILFGIVMGSYALGFWQPTIIQQTGIKDPFIIGLLTMVPYGLALISMITIGWHADKTRERRWHVAGPAMMAACGFLLCTQAGGSTTLAIMGLALAVSGVVTALPMFWALPTSFLGGSAAAAGIALINCTGNLAGFFSPTIIGLLKDYTGTLTSGLLLVACCLLGSAALILTQVPAKLVNR
jgi:D-galactonate transporter